MKNWFKRTAQLSSLGTLYRSAFIAVSFACFTTITASNEVLSELSQYSEKLQTVQDS